MAFGLAETAKLAVDLSLKGNFTSQLASSQKALKALDSQVATTGSRAYKAGTQIGTGIKRGAVIAASALGFLASQAIFGLRQLAILEKATAQTEAVLKSTGAVAGQTATSIRNLAEKYEGLNAIIDDKVIQSGENVLLTFTNIRKQAFEPALAAALDLSTALGKDLQSSVTAIGKALNDPAKGLVTLQRLGIVFTKTQKDQIAAALKANDTFAAQKVILDELGKRFGGSFARQGKTAEGAIAGIGDAVEDLQKALAQGLFPIIQKVLPKIRAALADPKVVEEVTKLGNSIAGLFTDENIAEGGRILSSVFNTAKAAAPVIKQAAAATLSIVQAAVSAFTSLPPELQTLAVGAFAVNKLTGGLVTNVVGGIAQFLAKSFTGNMNVTAGVVNVVGGPGIPGGGAAGAAGGIGGALKGGAKLLGGVGVAIIGIEALGELIKATSTPEQIATGESNAIAAGRQKHGAPTTPTGTRNDPLAVTLLDRGGREAGRDNFITAGGFDKRLATAVKRMTNAFQDAVAALRKSKTDIERRAAASKIGGLVESGKGSLEGTLSSASALRNALKQTHDPRTAAIIRAALAKVERKIPGREFAQRQIGIANRALADGKLTKAETTRLKGIMQALKDRGLPHAAAAIQEKINAAKRAQVAATNAAAAAIKAKDLSVTVNNTVNTTVSIRDVLKGSKQSSKFGKVYIG